MIKVKKLGTQAYNTVWADMKSFTLNRLPNTEDELWCVEHLPVFTQGQAGKPEHILRHTDIPIVQSDRGGQVTYHGPGQLVIYTLINLKNAKLSVRGLVSLIEQSVIDCLKSYDIESYNDKCAPGVYIQQKKVCSLGLRIKHGFSYHGLALNVNMDLTPYQYINPCGMNQLKMTNISDYVPTITLKTVEDKLISLLAERLGYDKTDIQLMTEN